MKWFILFLRGEGKDYLFKTESYAFSILNRQIAALNEMGIPEKDIVVLSNLEERRHYEPFKVVWEQVTEEKSHIQSIYQMASIMDCPEDQIAMWNTHCPLLNEKDFSSAMERWDRKGLLGTLERLRRHPYYLLREFDGETREIDFWLGRRAIKRGINGRQDLDSLFYLSEAFLFANLQDRTDYLADALSGMMQYYVIPETKAFSLERGLVDSCCVEEVLSNPAFYQRMGDSFNIKILEEMYPGCETIVDHECADRWH